MKTSDKSAQTIVLSLSVISSNRELQKGVGV